jgi:hypothetical protein
MEKESKIRKFVVKLQGLPDAQKKIIIFSVAIVAALIMGFFWIKSSADRIKNAGQSLQLMDLPKIDIPASLQEAQDANSPTPTSVPTPTDNADQTQTVNVTQ